MKLVHQIVINVQPAGGVHDEDIEAAVPGVGKRAACARHRIHLARRIVHTDAGLLADHRELLDGGRPADVGRHDQRVASLLRQPSPELAGGGRLPRPLQTEKEDHPRTRLNRRQPPLGVAEQRQHLVADDPHDLLRRREALQNLLIDRPVAHPVDESLHDLEVHVRLEQRHANLTQGCLNGHFGEACFAAKRAEHALEAVAQ